MYNIMLYQALCILNLTLKAPRKILEQTTIYFCFLFLRENNAWHYMWIVCQAANSHVMSSIISSWKIRITCFENVVCQLWLALYVLRSSYCPAHTVKWLKILLILNYAFPTSLWFQTSLELDGPKYSEIPLLRPPKIKTFYPLKTLFAKFKLFFSSFSTPSVSLIRDHLWDCSKVVFKTTFGQSQKWS